MAGYPVVDRVSEVLRLAAGKRVLHLGCTNWPYTAEAIRDGSLLHARLAEVASSLVGVDSDEAGIESLVHAGLGPIVRADLERLENADAPELAAPFDVVVAAEVIEHLDNPGLMLRGVRPLLGDDGLLVVTTINAYGAVRWAPYALRGRGGAQEPVHPDHVAYYSPATLGLLLRRHAYDLVDTSFYPLAREHRIHTAWWIKLANDVATTLSRQLADGLVMTARPRHQDESSASIHS